ncbi:hypothetical protein C6376_17080 [Streptomyces sp. P3]|uniref:hypothetical protein n=1 Tax=Streptomyces sp. P3 TaxID=2135430 RepID=UPI000D1BF5B3|nr:hypothetical protein [Streptomyces sp. P3]AVV42880.1 hypothetical protein C6376_17080 [Streptomyces sp. P3]
MGADRETNHDMAAHDIAFLLADAAGEVEIGIAPTQALIRGGRRRRARRWAVAAATAVVVVGSTGALAVTGLPGGDGDRATPAATQRVTESPTPFQPHNRVTLASGTDGGREWRVTLDVWPAPIDVQDARATMNAMAEYAQFPAGVRTPVDLVGKSAYFVHRSVGEEATAVQVMTLHGLTGPGDSLTGRRIYALADQLTPYGRGPARLVIGQVAKTARQVTCTWKNGTKTEVDRVPATTGVRADAPAVRTIDDSPYNWFVCLAPQGTEYASAEVTR